MNVLVIEDWKLIHGRQIQAFFLINPDDL